MPRLPIWFLLLWGSIVALSGVGFYYLSSRPQTLLWIEDYHPSNAYQKGRALKEEGQWEEALAAFQRGTGYFRELAEQNPLRRYRLQYLQGLLEMASVYEEMGDPSSLHAALDLWQKAVEIEPRYAEGQPFLARGMVLQRLGEYRKAVDAYSGALEYGSAPVALEAVLGRGGCYKELGDFPAAGRDWYWYARLKKGIAPALWNDLAAIPLDSCAEAYYLHARAVSIRGETKQAEECWRKYLTLNPLDRSAIYYFHRLTGVSMELDDGEIPLTDLFPVSSQYPRPLSSVLLDVYSDGDQPVELCIEITASNEKSTHQKVIVERDRQPVWEGAAISDSPHILSAGLILQAGVNIFHLYSQTGEEERVTPFLLHSLTVRPESRR